MVVTSKKTATMTFRIDEDILNKLRTESEHRETSLNTFVNQIFKRYVEWDMFESKVGMIPIASYRYGNSYWKKHCARYSIIYER